MSGDHESEDSEDVAREFADGLTKIPPFRPLAFVDEALDCVRVLWRDCSTVERRIDERLTLVYDNHHDEALVGFTVKGIAHANNGPIDMPLLQAADPATSGREEALRALLVEMRTTQGPIVPVFNDEMVPYSWVREWADRLEAALTIGQR